MIIYPAIDIRGGRCVRLTEGRFDAETVFADDPAEMAERRAVLEVLFAAGGRVIDSSPM